MLCCIHLHLCTTAKSSVRFMENYLSNGCNLWLLKLPELYFSEAERVLLGKQHAHCYIPKAQKKQIVSPQFPVWTGTAVQNLT